MGDVSRCSLYAKCEVTRCVPAVIGDCGVVQGSRVIEIGEPKLRRGVPPRGEALGGSLDLVPEKFSGQGEGLRWETKVTSSVTCKVERAICFRKKINQVVDLLEPPPAFTDSCWHCAVTKLISSSVRMRLSLSALKCWQLTTEFTLKVVVGDPSTQYQLNFINLRSSTSQTSLHGCYPLTH